ncbi:DUF2058 domain-containing protein [Aliagarivorans taiwanensis]|uniref:DUF2058 domain-containing protein n=1 Tax=Aliagarivorans taiwanensis TaxID=561966 RepID=UPI00040189B4|nr:DUF2058 domain-containing protein [Aliagarivorans taiwanensis]
MAKLSLQEQMMKAGLVSQKKAQKAKKQAKKGRTMRREVQAATQAQREEQLQRDQALNQQRNQEAQDKAIAAQVKQLITSNAIDISGGDITYNFTHDSVVKNLDLNAKHRQDVIDGRLAIAVSEGKYFVLAKVVAEKIAQRAPEAIVVLYDPASEQVDEDDPYADYQIPDDLMW